mgnify:CR=1 FL=1|jgi:hypothetical protein
MKCLLPILVLSSLVGCNSAHTSFTQKGDMAYEIMDHMVIDCRKAEQQYAFLESERTTKMQKLKAGFLNKTLIGSMYAGYNSETKWAYKTNSGTRDGIIDLQQKRIKELCYGGNGVPAGY